MLIWGIAAASYLVRELSTVYISVGLALTALQAWCLEFAVFRVLRSVNRQMPHPLFPVFVRSLSYKPASTKSHTSDTL
jgi:hypothetical protein